MKNTKMTLILILTALLLALSACGGKDDDTGSKKDRKRTEESDDKDQKEKVQDPQDGDAWQGDFLSEAEKLKEKYYKKMSKELLDRYGDESYLVRAEPESNLLFEFVDINGDGVPEMIAFDTEGYFAWITTYTDGNAVTKELFDNYDPPIGFTDYSAGATISSKNHEIMLIEYDCTYEKGFGMYRPGAEWEDLEEREYDTFIYLTVYKIDAKTGMKKADKYQCQYRHDIPYVPDESTLMGDRFVEASHNKEAISEEEFREAMLRDGYDGDVYFGCPQDGGVGLHLADAEKLLHGERLTFTCAEEMYNSEEIIRVWLMEADNPDGYSYYYRDMKRTELPPDLKPGDELTFSFQNGWEKNTVAEEADIPADGEWKEAYVQKVKEYYKENVDSEDEWSLVCYDLIYFDDDDIPELVTGLSGSRVSLYTYRDGQIVPIFEEWPYGAFGNSGYDYLERQSIVTGADSDYAGALYWIYYLKWDPETGEFNDVNDKALSIRYFNDKNGDGEPQDDEYLGEDEDEYYYYGDDRVSKEEFDSHCVEGDEGSIYGSLSYLEILRELGESDARALQIVSADATSELDVASKDNATYHATNLYDGDTKTAWVEGVDGDGVGESITLHLDGKHKIDGMLIYNGFLNTKRRYAINGKVSKVNVDYGNGYTQSANLIEVYMPEEETEIDEYRIVPTLIIPDEPVETDTIRITITEATPGSKYHDTAVSEIELYGE